MFGCSNNLIKNIVGSGVLCLAGGVAAFTDQPKMLAVAVGIALVFAALAGYCFNFVAATCRLTGARSYTEAWAKTVGENTAWIPNLIVVFKTWSACLIYSMIIGDLLTDLAVTFGELLSSVSLDTAVLRGRCSTQVTHAQNLLSVACVHPAWD
eukprot:3332559-Rhodomonas_salina.1